MCWWKSATAAWPTTSSRIGHNFEAVLGDLETRMREAAADLNFEEAARLRDEVKRLRATELAVVDDPTVKQRTVQNKAGAYAGAKKYGEAANLPRMSSQARRQQHAARGWLLCRRGAGLVRRSPKGEGGWGVHESQPLKSPQAPSRRNARPGIPALPSRRRTATQTARRLVAQRQQDLPAYRLAPIRPRIRPHARARTAARRASGWVEEAVAIQRR